LHGPMFSRFVELRLVTNRQTEAQTDGQTRRQHTLR